MPKLSNEKLLSYIFYTLTNTNHNLTALKGGLDDILQFKNPDFSKYYDEIYTKKNTSPVLSPLHYLKKYGADLNAIV